MNITKIQVTSVTNNVSFISPIVLKENEKFRLIFKPEFIANNPNDSEKHLRGELWTQRKGDNESWIDYKTFDNSRLKKGECTKVELGTQELAKLFEGLSQLKSFFDSGYKQDGEYLFVPNSENVKTLLEWASSVENAIDLIDSLKLIPIEKIRNFSSLIDIAHLENIVKTWEQNKTNTTEEFWQKLLTQNSWLLSQLFILPLIIAKDKAYVGGKSIVNKDGNIVDYLCRNKVSGNISLIEIKTPHTKLTGSEYRGVFSMSSELSGATVQLASYRQTLLNEWNSIAKDFPELNAINPKCVLIIGSLENIDSKQKEAFELYRTGYKDIEIITFDELFEKVSSLISLLKENNNTKTENEQKTNCNN